MRWFVAFILNIFLGLAVEAVLKPGIAAVALLIIGSLIVCFALAPSIAALMEDWVETFWDGME